MTVNNTLLLKQPTVSTDQIAFLYAGDIWTAGRDGSHPRRLTAQKGQKTTPLFSPDGDWIAFSGNYDGNTSVYVIPSEGGSPVRLTYHPDEDWVRGWTPDGRSVLFSSGRDSVSRSTRRLFTIALEGGLPQPLPIHMAERGMFSPELDNSGNPRYLAYTSYREPFWSWKRYRGGMTLPIWILDLKTFDHIEIPHENASDSFPCWIGNEIYFLSDRCGAMNVFHWQMGQPDVEQITFHQDYDVRSLTSGAGQLAYEQAGQVHLLDPNTKQTTTLSISIPADLPYTRPKFHKGERYIQNAGISPTGARAVFEVRGDIFTVPAKKGDVRNLTHTPGSAERFPAWSPDGQSIAYFSDENSEYELVITDQKGEQKTWITINPPTFFYHPVWSPDSQKIAFTDKALHLYFVDVKSKTVTLVDTDTYEHPERSLNPAWSPDSLWLGYTKRLDSHIRAVFLYSIAENRSVQVTDGMSDTTDACFSTDGKYLFFTASSNYGLNTGWLDMSSYERPVTRSLYLLVLNKEDPSPFAPESDEEKAPEEAKSQEGDKKEEGEEKDKEKKAPPELKIDLEGMNQRILSLPAPPKDYSDLQAVDGKLFYKELLPYNIHDLRTDTLPFKLHVFDFKEKKAEVFIEKIRNYWISANGKKMLYQEFPGRRYFIGETEKQNNGKEVPLPLDSIDAYVDPRAEWKQIFREAFRIHRDFFYDAAMHGIDLKAAYQKYLPFLEHVGHRDDLNYLLAEFSGELVVGHAYVGMGDIPAEGPVGVGLLGADFEVTPDGFYRIRRILPGLNWHPELRSPLTELGVNVNEGEYLLAVNGRPLRAPVNVFHLLEKTAGKVTDLRIGSSPDGESARTVSVRPIGSETGLRHWNWVESNRQRVNELSGGRIAYVYLPNTALEGYENFNRYYFSQLDKTGVVLDERFNGGGSVADYIIDMLNRPVLSYWATRDGKPFTTPNTSIPGPRVMIINEQAGSGGDAMPLFFRRCGLGKLVGKRTWGGLIGIYDYPSLIDGGFFTSPRVAIFSPQGEWEVENEGVAPDIEVEMTPKLVIEGRDPQLEKAVEIILAELEAAPPTRPERPKPAIRL